ncbi:MAG TPA: hypothetical protein VLX44_04030 [Xanthobacteraceae bacterium]|nr:hypothetical protein [Xanthobacteraceae bacterium]
MLRGLLPFGRHYLFRDATARTHDSGADLRWGPDRTGFRRFIHPNGICLTGRWRITEDTPYSGYFRKGSEALIVGRYSVCCSATRRGRTRSLSLVGKLFPTADPDHEQPLRTANFITQQDLGGDYANFINDAESPDAPTRTPLYMRLLVAPDQPRIAGDALDFRDEIMAQIYDRGDPTPKRTLTFNIEVTDAGATRGINVYERRTFANWRRIAEIVFDRAVASYNGDFVIHFNHPTWRDDPNDRSTATRVKERKVR